METTSPQQLLNDSFSYGWLLNVKSAGSLDDSRRSFDGGSFIEIDPDFISMRWSNVDAMGFDFALPTSQCSVQVHADQIFSNGHLLPLHVRGPSSEGEAEAASLRKSQSVNSNRYESAFFCPASASATSSPLFHSAKSSPNSPISPASRSGKFDSHFIRDCANSPKKILCKYFCFLMPLYKMVKDFRLVSSKSVSSCKDSARSSPRTSSAMSSIDWCGSNADISVNDAILHCKKSIGQD